MGKVRTAKIHIPEGFEAVLSGGKRTIYVYKHTKRNLYKIIAENEENLEPDGSVRRTEVIFSGEALAAIFAMVTKLGGVGDFHSLILPSIDEDSLLGHWKVVYEGDE